MPSNATRRSYDDLHREFNLNPWQSSKLNQDQPRQETNDLDFLSEDQFLQLAHNLPIWRWHEKGHETFRVCPKCNKRFYEQSKLEDIPNANGIIHTYIRNEYAERCDQCKVNLIYNDALILDKNTCCFRHLVGLPTKERKHPTRTDIKITEVMPIFDWQKLLYYCYNDLNHDYVFIKSTGLGATEWKNTDIVNKATRDYKLSDAMIPILVGQNMVLSEEMIDRIKGLLPFEIKEANKKSFKLNGCKIRAFPANHIASIRSIKNPYEIIFDEFDFIKIGSPGDILTSISRYKAKAWAPVKAISTPRNPMGLCHTLEDHPQGFKIIKLHYTVGLYSLYSQAEIDEQKTKPGFDQEYCLVYGGTVGNFIDPYDVKAVTVDYSLTPNQFGYTIMAVDPGYSQDSLFAITIITFVKGQAYIMYSSTELAPMPDDKAKEIQQLYHKYYVDKILIDGSEPSFILPLKALMHDYSNFVPLDYRKIKDKTLFDRMIIEPIPFVNKEYQFLVHTRNMIKSKRLLIHPCFNNVISGLVSVWVEYRKYIKTKSIGNDTVDTISMALSRLFPKEYSQVILHPY